MTKVITYGTYDRLHYGHIRLLERAKALGDYLIVGVTADDFDKTRGKINVQQSLMERVDAVKETGLADEIIIEEYEGQKIDDIRRYDVDIFTVGSDWIGTFDYLNEYCRVVYLERTEGVSSSEIRANERFIRLGLVGESPILEKYYRESQFVNGLNVNLVYTENSELFTDHKEKLEFSESFEALIDNVEAVYIASHPGKHYEQIKYALERGKHVLCESPITLEYNQCVELFHLAHEKNLILFDAIKTAYSTAYNRLLLLLKSGKIGRILSVDATCTSLQEINITNENKITTTWNSICAWGPTALLPIFQILGTSCDDIKIASWLLNGQDNFDLFTRVSFTYPGAVATLKVGKGVKSEGELIISGSKGYVYIPAPWWKTDYFEIRFENQSENKRYFYQLDGEGIRYELVAFLKSITNGKKNAYVAEEISKAIVNIMDKFEKKENFTEL